MRVTTKITWDMNTGEVLEHEWYEYDGPLVLQCGRSNTGKSQETGQVGQNNSVRDQGIAQMNRGMNWANNAIIDLDQNPGYTPEQKAAMRARSAAVIGGTYQGAEDKLARTNAASGKYNDTGLVPNLKELTRDKARMETGKNLDYELEDANQALTTRREIPNLIAGVNIHPYSGLVTGSMGDNSSLIDSRMTADNAMTFPEMLALAGMNSAGQVGAAAVPKAGCWIAEAVYGVDDPRTHILRAWLNLELGKRGVGRAVMMLYRQYGRAVAAGVRRSPLLQLLARLVVDCALPRATAWVRATERGSEVAMQSRLQGKS